MSRGRTATIERIRDDIAQVDADIVDCLPYDITPFNEAAHDGGVLVHCIGLGEPHPAFINVPLEGYDFQLCLICPKPCGGPVREFAEAICTEAAQKSCGSAR